MERDLWYLFSDKNAEEGRGVILKEQQEILLKQSE